MGDGLHHQVAVKLFSLLSQFTLLGCHLCATAFSALRFASFPKTAPLRAPFSERSRDPGRVPKLNDLFRSSSTPRNRESVRMFPEPIPGMHSQAHKEYHDDSTTRYVVQLDDSVRWGWSAGGVCCVEHTFTYIVRRCVSCCVVCIEWMWMQSSANNVLHRLDERQNRS